MRFVKVDADMEDLPPLDGDDDNEESAMEQVDYIESVMIK